ncbi:uncharacterized protein LOC134467063 [Engraulis encrasicolus]|uniref:uncharacterized protein LOC134467063 n=1 Tax=Engraulis encrasicolus TaxID=184585 RepID=UPI002FD45649
MSEETFTCLCNKLRPSLEQGDTNFRACVPLRKRVAVALWKLATGSDNRTIGQLFGVSIPTVCRCVQEFVAAAVLHLITDQIAMFPDQDKLADIAADFNDQWGLPNCVGAIDVLHIPIEAPVVHHTDYRNQKGWHSILLQAVVDGKGLFWNVLAGMPGGMRDARLLKLSALWKLTTERQRFSVHTRDIGGVTTGCYLLGDSAYPLQSWLMKPLQDNGRLTAEQQAFNQRLRGARVVVENAFGRLKGRWRCLLKKSECDLKLVQSMVLVCCALHNLCERQGDEYESGWDAEEDPVVEQGEEEEEEEDSGVEQGEEEEGGSDVHKGLMLYLLNR